ncbi:Uma2 family endonuclease [Alkalinema sp. FACHB-956]|uniref:Uma2 family endonuclease n=1 Tax=Alkalinema sp. FACHB-956 TaxID=2692768 RepID=UPI001681DEEE|nr:Uma2 family endonuclease [Alkalinema sp. FACHB-956]MBD2328252.1 Uma2 family endonuclease [Alkalinema sp. FACHB-956]
MVNSALQSTTSFLASDRWIQAGWNDYLQAIEQSAPKAKGYYHNGRMRIEMSPVGNPHSRDHAIIIHAVTLYAGIKGIDLDGHDNCTYRKTGYAEAQPDASFYIGEPANVIPWDTTIIDLDCYPAPTLAIEVAYSSLADDKGEKRLLYEAIGVSEYWIIDVENVQVLAFAVENQGSRRIRQSQVLAGLDIAVLEDAFRQSRQTNHGQVSAWLLRQWQQP